MDELSQVLDRKFDEKLQPIKTDLGTVKTDLEMVKTDLEMVRTDLEMVRTDLEMVRTDLEMVRTDVDSLKTDLEIVKKTMATKEDLESLTKTIAGYFAKYTTELEGKEKEQDERIERLEKQVFT